jgi:anti-anti-sigma factor
LNEGRILVAEHDGVYLLKLDGDVRLTLCSSISQYLEKIFSCRIPSEVYVDLLDAECVDSTTLGLLARLAIHTQRVFGFKTRLLCVNRNILRVFEAMDIDGLFEILGASSLPRLAPAEVAQGSGSA